MNGRLAASPWFSAGLLAAGIQVFLAGIADIVHEGGHRTLATPAYKVDIALRVKNI